MASRLNALFNVYRHFDLPKEAEALARGTSASRDITGFAPLDVSGIGFPPGLLPVLCDASWPQYRGYWVFPFGRRRSTFVDYDVEESRVYECARTWDQFVARLLLTGMESNGFDSSAQEFAREMKVADVESLAQTCAQYGDDPAGFALHPLFADTMPLCRETRASYRGDFPNPTGSLESLDLDSCTSLELAVEEAEACAHRTGAPEWFALKPGEAFERLLVGGNHSGAWFSLNSRGWSFADAARAAQALLGQNASLDALLGNWIDLHKSLDGGY